MEDEGLTREHGAKARAAYRVDPRPEAHSPLTARLIAPTSPFALDLNRSIDLQVARASLGFIFRFEVAFSYGQCG